MMKVTDVQVYVIRNAKNGLVGSATVEFDGMLCIRDVKIIERRNGTLHIAMPTRFRDHSCFQCGRRNQARARYCNFCRGELPLPEPGRLDHDIVQIRDDQFWIDVQDEVVRTYEYRVNNALVEANGDGQLPQGNG